MDSMDARWAFAHKYRDVGLGNCGIFTDSKYFVAGTVDVATKNSGFHSWAPNHEPRRVIKTQGNTYSAHVYGGVVCKYGLTELLFVSGTKGLSDAYTVNRKNPLFKKGDSLRSSSRMSWRRSIGALRVEMRAVALRRSSLARGVRRIIR